MGNKRKKETKKDRKRRRVKEEEEGERRGRCRENEEREVGAAEELEGKIKRKTNTRAVKRYTCSNKHLYRK